MNQPQHPSRGDITGPVPLGTHAPARAGQSAGPPHPHSGHPARNYTEAGDAEAWLDDSYTAQRRQSVLKPILLGALGAACVLAVAGTIAVIINVDDIKQQGVEQDAIAATPEPGQPTGAEPTAMAGDAQPGATPATAAAAGAAAAAPVIQGPPAVPVATASRPPRRAVARGTELPMESVVRVVSRHASSLVPCLQKALDAGEIDPGQHTLMLGWRIRADGTVTQPTLEGPAGLTSTSLSRCVPSVMRKWRFPEAGRSTSISDFPLGPVVIQ